MDASQPTKYQDAMLTTDLATDASGVVPATSSAIVLSAPILICGAPSSFADLTARELASFGRRFGARLLPSAPRAEKTLRFGKLSEDDDLMQFTPLVAWSLSPEIVPMQPETTRFLRDPRDIVLRIYPNNIALLSMTLQMCIDTAHSERAEIALLEQTSTNLVQSIADVLGEELQLLEGHAAMQTWPYTGLLWSSRIFCAKRLNVHGSLFHKLNLHKPDESKLSEDDFFVGIGNNVFVTDGSTDLAEFVKAFEIGQICFAVNDEWTRALRRLQDDTLRYRSAKPIRGVERRLNALITQIGIFHAESHDLFRCLQGSRKAVLEDQFRAWNIAGLQESVVKRSVNTSRMVAGYISERSGLYQGFVEAGLVMIGGMAVLQFIIEFWDYAESHFSSEGKLGFIWLAQHLSVEVPSVIASIAILALVLLRLFGTRQ